MYDGLFATVTIINLLATRSCEYVILIVLIVQLRNTCSTVFYFLAPLFFLSTFI